MSKVLVLGLGNDLLTDDAVGLHVANEVRQRLGEGSEVAVKATTEMGPSTLDLIAGFAGLVIVDSIITGKSAPGHIHTIEPDRFRRYYVRSPHALGVNATCALGRTLGLPMPTRVRIVAVEVSDPFTLGTDMTPAVEDAIGDAADRVVECVRELAHQLPAPAAS